jgi:hypothetical protein
MPISLCPYAHTQEDPVGTFQELEAEHEYFVIVVEDNEQAMKVPHTDTTG